LLTPILGLANAKVAYVEFTSARPTDAKASAFAFGRARGIIEGVAGALGLPLVFVAPAVWKRAADIPAGKEFKDVARTRAIARWPQHATLFARVKYDCQKRRWQFDCDGVSELEAAKHGYRPLLPPVAPLPRVDPAYARAVRDKAAAATWARKRAAREKAAKKAAAKERARVRRKAYFAAWYKINQDKVAARRKAQREAARTK
jgi:hypothetical protein